MNDVILRQLYDRGTAIGLIRNDMLNQDNWIPAGVPLGDGGMWMYQDDNAKVNYTDDSIRVEIRPFSLSHDHVQIFDNPKHLYLTKSDFEPGADGLIGFACRMTGEIIDGNRQDYRDGFCAFNVLDFSTGMVFDIISNGHNVWVIYERLLMPGVTTEKEAFTSVIPIKWTTSPQDILECATIYDKNKDTVRFYVGKRLIHEVENVPVKIERLQAGFGMITLHPIENGKSVSCKGQGGIGSWGGFRVYRS